MLNRLSGSRCADFAWKSTNATSNSTWAKLMRMFAFFTIVSKKRYRLPRGTDRYDFLATLKVRASSSDASRYIVSKRN